MNVTIPIPMAIERSITRWLDTVNPIDASGRLIASPKASST